MTQQPMTEAQIYCAWDGAGCPLPLDQFTRLVRAVESYHGIAAGVALPVANEQGHPNNRLLFKDMCRFFGIELGKDTLMEARAKIDARGVSASDGKGFGAKTPIPSPMDYEGEG